MNSSSNSDTNTNTNTNSSSDSSSSNPMIAAIEIINVSNKDDNTTTHSDIGVRGSDVDEEQGAMKNDSDGSNTIYLQESATINVNGLPLSRHDDDDDDDDDNNGRVADDEIQSVWGFTYPWSADWCLSVIGSEYCHSYFWIAKDLAWTQGWRFFALFYGSAAILWWGIIGYHALRTRNPDEVWNAIALLLWLSANFWWMAGEAHDHAFPDAISISDLHTDQSAHMLEAALVWLAIYYLIILPFNLFPASPEAIAEYDDGEYTPRFSYFKNYRQYENVHMLFWCAKDLAWNRNNTSMWFVFLWPTVLVAADFLYISAFHRNQVVDTVHYAATLLWVSGNMTWALGEFFFGNYDEPLVMWHSSKEALKTARWWSSWILFLALLIVFLLYCVWIPITCSGKLSNISTNASKSADQSLRKNRTSLTHDDDDEPVDVDADQLIDAPRNHLKYAEENEELFLLLANNSSNNNSNSSSSNNSSSSSNKINSSSTSRKKVAPVVERMKDSGHDDGELR